MTELRQATAAQLVGHIDHFQRRVIQDALLEATAAYWRARAIQFEHAFPRSDDYPGGGVIGGSGYYPAPSDSRPSYWFPGPRLNDRLCPGVHCVRQTPAQPRGSTGALGRRR